MKNQKPPHFRGIEVKWMPITNTKPARIQLYDTRQGQRKYIPVVDDEHIVFTATEYLSTRGIPVFGFSGDHHRGVYHLFTNDFTESIR